MKSRSRRICGSLAESRGFALIASISVTLLLALVCIAYLTLAANSAKSVRQDKFEQEARANARLALMIALGELQREMGPDQRVSAPADFMGNEESPVTHPYWTGVWRTTQEDGSPILVRDDVNGGLKDTRISLGSKPEQTRLNYLISGNESGMRVRDALKHEANAPLDEGAVTLVAGVSAGADQKDHVEVPKVPLYDGSRISGSYGFWVGDLGVKANIRSRNPYQEEDEVSANFPLLAGQSAAPEVMEVEGASLTLEDGDQEKLATMETVSYLAKGGRKWSQALFHDATVHSQGVLSDVRGGGLRGNLTSFLNEDEDVKPLMASGQVVAPGLSAQDNMVGPANAEDAVRDGAKWEDTRHQVASPKFGLLRDWARLGEKVSLAAKPTEAKLPKSEPNFELPEALVGSSQNLNPATLSSFDQANLAPILVEGSMFITYSTHLNAPGSGRIYNLRSHRFPRVVLWNPYSVPLILDDSMVMLQVNGRRGFKTDAWQRGAGGGEIYRGTATWLSFGGRTGRGSNFQERYDDKYTGSAYFKIPKTTFQAGECLVFLPEKAAEYDFDNLLNNTLSASAEYEPRNNFYISASANDGSGMNWYPKNFAYAPSNDTAWFEDGVQKTQGDDSQMILKHIGNESEMTPERFDDLRQIASVSCSLQFGAGREPVEAWSHEGGLGNGVPVEFLSREDPQITLVPDRRTRQGYRLRWFREHESHLNILDNPLANEPEFWEESMIGSWNLRAAFSSRSPFDNLAGNVGNGLASGPWFFGVYTKDLYDDAVGWRDQFPIFREGKNHGNPFGIPSEGAKAYVLYDVPRGDVGVFSLAQFQHAKVSEFVWHPSYAIGNSLVDPRLGGDGLAGTSPKLSQRDRESGGYTKEAIGWSNDEERGEHLEAWADAGKGFLLDTPDEENVVYDLSFELNHTLWDRYFLSSGTTNQLKRAAEKPAKNLLPNSRMKPRWGATSEELSDYHRAASKLMLDGAFNVNSTSVEAWKAVLSANRKEKDAMTPFPRVLNGEGEEWGGGKVTRDGPWVDTRVLSDAEIQKLAEEIVREVRERGPFLSLADFVNRRLAEGPHGKAGPIESAIEAAGINDSLISEPDYEINRASSLSDYAHPDNIEDSTRFEQTLKPSSKAWGASAFLTQADVLQVIGPSLSARSDTFVIRAYGESISKGNVKARAWCEAVVQRVPDPISPDTSGLNPEIKEDTPDFGRRFEIVDFRWLNSNEI